MSEDDAHSHRSSKSDAASIEQHLKEKEAKIVENTEKNFGHLSQKQRDEIARSAFEHVKLELVDTQSKKYGQFYSGLFAEIDKEHISESEKEVKKKELERLIKKDR